jgi:uncharacterized protein YfaP (DUF2135 family)
MKPILRHRLGRWWHLGWVVLGSVPMDMPANGPIHTPVSGWVHSGLDAHNAPVEVAYPNNLIDRGGQRGRTLIQGKLNKLKTTRRGSGPARLVVNGNAMPLATDQEGRFARPYAFGPGSNSIEVRSDGVRQRIQFFEADPLKTKARIRVILAWDDPHAELDLHVLTPDGGHAFFGNPVLPQGGGLDVDSVDGAGPEMFSMTAPLPGLYHVYLNYWGRFGAEGYHFDDETREQPMITAHITVVLDENTGAEKRQTLSVPVRRIGELMLVQSFQRRS